jgi:8-oxo-dGTP diphosphatase
MNIKSPKLTVDGIIFDDEKILLIKRRNNPYKGKWALPGGFVDYGEKTEVSVVREISEETGLNTRVNKLIGVYSDPKRDPRGHTVTIVYELFRINGDIKSGDDACDIKFFRIDDLPELSFDHKIIIEDFLRGV